MGGEVLEDSASGFAPTLALGELTLCYPDWEIRLSVEYRQNLSAIKLTSGEDDEEEEGDDMTMMAAPTATGADEIKFFDSEPEVGSFLAYHPRWTHLHLLIAVPSGVWDKASHLPYLFNIFFDLRTHSTHAQLTSAPTPATDTPTLHVLVYRSSNPRRLIIEAKIKHP